MMICFENFRHHDATQAPAPFSSLVKPFQSTSDADPSVSHGASPAGSQRAMIFANVHLMRSRVWSAKKIWWKDVCESFWFISNIILILMIGEILY